MQFYADKFAPVKQNASKIRQNNIFNHTNLQYYVNKNIKFAQIYFFSSIKYFKMHPDIMKIMLGFKL